MLTVLAIIVLGKSVAAALLVLALRYPLFCAAVSTSRDRRVLVHPGRAGRGARHAAPRGQARLAGAISMR
jgi:hypothetical protein